MTTFRLAGAVLAAVVLVVGGSSALYAAAEAQTERALGKKDAPVLMEEYASLTCPHCADFTADVLPQIEKRYIETGKVRYVFHSFPIDGVALKASVLARCMPADQYYPFINVLYKNLKQWALSPSPEQTLIQYAKLGGLPDDKAKACLDDTKMLDTIVEEREEAQKKYDINSTPTFIFNGGKEKLVGALKLDDYTAVIERLLVPPASAPAPAPAPKK
jgi:protein-disulfide isomerase